MQSNTVDDIIRTLLHHKFHKHVDLPEQSLTELLQNARQVVLQEPSFLELSPPINVIGDIHGQFGDLLSYFQATGFPSTQQYLMLGDYVDRGKRSIETLTLLLAFKVKYPKQIHLLRGNHESANINLHYGFYDECKRRLSIRMWREFVDCYTCLPIAALIEKRIFCCHGGLSPSLRHFDDIRKIVRPTSIPDSGLLCDLLWADPSSEHLGWSHNNRGVSYCFGADIVDQFVKHFNVDIICRAHQVVEDGYEFFAKRQLITVFSAANYCGEYDNAGSMMVIDSELLISFVILRRPLPKRKSVTTTSS